LHLFERVLAKSFPLDKVFIKAAQRGKSQPDKRSGHPYSHALEQEFTKLLRLAVLPGCPVGTGSLKRCQRVPISDHRSWRGVSFDLEKLQVTFKVPVLFGIRHIWEEYTSLERSQFLAIEAN
jgi:hypothetical protein